MRTLGSSIPKAGSKDLRSFTKVFRRTAGSICIICAWSSSRCSCLAAAVVILATEGKSVRVQQGPRRALRNKNRRGTGRGVRVRRRERTHGKLSDVSSQFIPATSKAWLSVSCVCCSFICPPTIIAPYPICHSFRKQHGHTRIVAGRGRKTQSWGRTRFGRR